MHIQVIKRTLNFAEFLFLEQIMLFPSKFWCKKNLVPMEDFVALLRILEKMEDSNAMICEWMQVQGLCGGECVVSEREVHHGV